VLSAASFAAGCGGANPAEEFGMKDQNAIRANTGTFAKAFNAKDASTILTSYTENATYMPPNQPVVRGKDAVKIFLDDQWKAGAHDLKMEVTEVSGHGPLAYESGTYEMDLQAPKGGVAHDRGKYLFVLRRMNNTWRTEYSVWNSDLPVSSNE